MSIADWVIGKLGEDGTLDGVALDIERMGTNAFVVHRPDRPAAVVFCPDASDSEPFEPVDLLAARDEIDGLQFVVPIRRAVANSTYAAADVMGICIGTLNLLRAALMTEYDVSRYQPADMRFLQSRLAQNRYVEGYIRAGRYAFTIDRTGSRRRLEVIFLEHYEISADTVYELLNEHPDIAADAIVTTNPNCQGFAADAERAARDAGIRLLTLKQFLSVLGDSWD